MSLFLQIYRENEPSFFVESGDEGGRLSRYTTLGFNPLFILRVRKGQFILETETTEFILKVGNPIEHLKKYLTLLQPVPHPQLSSALVGAFGFIGYDCVKYLENIRITSKENVLDDACVILFQDYAVFDRVKHQVQIFAIGGDTTSEQSIQKRLDYIYNQFHEVSLKPTSHDPFLNTGVKLKSEIEFSVSKRQQKNFDKKIAQIKEHIKQGDIFQCVLSEKRKFKLKTNPIHVYRHLRAENPSSYHYFFDTGSGIFLGASPEMLVRVSKGIVETCPIAGTRPRGKTEEENQRFAKNLLDSPKERAEHMMLVDLGRNDVGRISAPGSVKVTKFMEVRNLSHVMHLISIVQGKLRRGLTAWDAFFSCFPAGTLSGAPKIRAMQIISELEDENRGFYGGAVVMSYFGGDLDSCISIRSLSYKNGIAMVQSGAGIVTDSKAKKELEEIIGKSRAIRVAITKAERKL